MSDLYYYSEIRGCIALKDIKKGTLIVSDRTNCFTDGNDECLEPDYKGEVLEAQNFVKRILSSFFQMSENDQAQYLKLPNKFDDTKSFPQAAIQLKYFESLIKRSDEDFNEKKLKVIAIFATNNFSYPVESNGESYAPGIIGVVASKWQHGVIIKVSQFHHSCQPNTVTESYLETFEVRAITKIKAGQEITLSHFGGSDPSYSMFPLKARQMILYEQLFFICSCQLCQKQNEEIRVETEIGKALREVTEKYLYESVREEMEERSGFFTQHSWKESPRFKQYFTENSKKARPYIENVKNLFNYGKEKKVQPICLYTLLQNGYFVASLIYQLTEHKYQKMFFEKEAINFAKSAMKFENILGSEFVRPEVWRNRQKFGTATYLFPTNSTFNDGRYKGIDIEGPMDPLDCYSLPLLFSAF